MKTFENDTICAVATAPGVGGIAVIRISGPRAIEAADSLWRGKKLADQAPRTVHLGNIVDPGHDCELLDQAVATIFRAPASFTGEDTVEFAVHGSRYVQRRLLQLLCDNGCRLAEPGEFTRRAFANGRMDLAQAEAVADVIASNSRAAHRLAASQMKGNFSHRLEELRAKLLELASLLELELDFSEEEVEFASRTKLIDIATELHTELTRLSHSFRAGNAIKEGIPVAIIGPTNAGKSSLLNRLLGEERAIVSDIHGTTRDTIEDTLEIGDYLFRFIDTAGLRDTTDPIETIGIQRTRAAAARAAITLLVLDSTQPLPPPATLGLSTPISTSAASVSPASPTGYCAGVGDSGTLLLLLNKSDLAPTHPDLPTLAARYGASAALPISAKTGLGETTLRTHLLHIADTLRGDATEDTILVTNQRHAQALAAAATTTAAVLDALRHNLPGDLIAQDLRATIHHLSLITGALTTPDILTSIFSRFCIGK